MPSLLNTSMIITSIIYNLSILVVLYKGSRSIDLRQALREKSAALSGSALAATATGAAQGAAAGAQAAGNTDNDAAALGAAAGAARGAIVAATAQVGPGADQAGDSYSRITGLVGATVLVCFIWGVGNVVLYNAFVAPEAVEKVLSGVGTFILSGTALFAPYAFNQLSRAFGRSSA